MDRPTPLDVPTSRALDSAQSLPMMPMLELPGVFSPEECRRIVGLHETLGHHEATFPSAGPRDGTRRSHSVDHERRYSDRTHVFMDGAQKWIYDRVSQSVARANELAWGFKLSFIEPLQLLVYPVGGHITWQTDLGDRGMTSHRKVSATILLSPPEAYDGGNLEVMTGGRVLEPSRAIGQGIFFSAFQSHRVTPVTRGERAVLIVWTIGKRPFV